MDRTTAPAEKKPATRVSRPLLQRNSECGACSHDSGSHDQLLLQRTAKDGTPQNQTAPVIVHQALQSPGQPLDGGTRSHFESRLGHDFSRVRVHTGAQAGQSAEAVHALAYTVGQDVVFGPGKYAPETPAGRRLIAHELVHTIQQEGTSGVSAAASLQIASPAHPAEHEAEAGARAIDTFGQYRPTGRQALQVYRQAEAGAPIDAGAAFSARVEQLACVIRQGGCASSRAGGVPTAEEIARYNQICRAKTNYSGTDITPSAVDCASGKSLPVPVWTELPPYAQSAIASKGYNQAWFNTHDDALRLTVLNLYVKMSGLGLWDYVGSEVDSGTGVLQFNSSDVRGLKNNLTARNDFSSPEESMEDWSSREIKSSGSIHIKHFKGWPETKVQAHIDQLGLLINKWWWLLPVVPLAQMLLHLSTYESYKDVYGIRDILLSEGWDPVPLRGTSTAVNQK